MEPAKPNPPREILPLKEFKSREREWIRVISTDYPDLMQFIKKKPRDVANHLCEQLQETKKYIFHRMVLRHGKIFPLLLFGKTMEIMKRGGLKTVDGSRTRTPGGTYLQQYKHHSLIQKSDTKFVFHYEEVNKNRRKAERRKFNRKFAKLTCDDPQDRPSVTNSTMDQDQSIMAKTLDGLSLNTQNTTTSTASSGEGMVLLQPTFNITTWGSESQT